MKVSADLIFGTRPTVKTNSWKTCTFWRNDALQGASRSDQVCSCRKKSAPKMKKSKKQTNVSTTTPFVASGHLLQ